MLCLNYIKFSNESWHYINFGRFLGAPSACMEYQANSSCMSRMQKKIVNLFIDVDINHIVACSTDGYLKDYYFSMQ